MPRSQPSLALSGRAPAGGPLARYFAAAARFAAFAFSCIVAGGGMSSTLPPAFSIAARAPAVTRWTFTETAPLSSAFPRMTMPSWLPFTSPAALRAAGSTTPESPSRSATCTSSSSRRWMLLNPNFGRRRWSGIWPPSKPSKCLFPERAFWPLPPRPAVLPRPEAWPRPTRVFRRFAPLGALRFESDMKGLLLPSGCADLTRRPADGGSGLGLGLASLAADGRGSVHPLPLDEVRNLPDHPKRLGGVGEDLRGVALLEAEARDDDPVFRRAAGEPLDELHFDGSHLVLSYAPESVMSATCLPRSRAASSTERSRLSPATVALSTLCGLREPWHFVSTLRTPAASRTARTAPPAMTPVPSPAGFRSTRPEPKCPSTSCGMVVPTSGTRKSAFFAWSPPLRIASGTSLAFPRPTPTWPAPSPTTTRAEKLNRRPPFTTLATRLMWTTLSFRSRSFALMGVAIRLS